MRVRAVMALVLGLLLAGCSSGDAETSTTAPSTSITTATTVQGTESTTSAPSAPSTSSPPALEFGDVITVDVVVLDEVDAGPHPVLGWEPFVGASSYWVMVRDGDGAPYWAWVGGETTVRVGGGVTEEANQTAVVHEEMTWRVAAFDESGTLIAISEPGSLAP